MNGPLSEAARLLLLATKNLDAATAMIGNKIFADEIFGFHIQQTIELALKAWLAHLGKEYPYRHDLGELITALAQSGIDVEALWGLVKYTPFAVQFRYEVIAPNESTLDRAAATAETKMLVDQVGALLRAKK